MTRACEALAALVANAVGARPAAAAGHVADVLHAAAHIAARARRSNGDQKCGPAAERSVRVPDAVATLGIDDTQEGDDEDEIVEADAAEDEQAEDVVV